MATKLPEAQSLNQELLKKNEFSVRNEHKTKPIKTYVKNMFFTREVNGCNYHLVRQWDELFWVKMGRDGKQFVDKELSIDSKYNINKLNRITLPTGVGNYCSVENLIERIEATISLTFHLTNPIHLKLASLYTLSTWTFDLHPELGYIGITAPPESGKSCFLDTLSEVVYCACRVSGSATEAAFFRIIDQFRTTVLMDEAQRDSSNPNGRFHKIITEGFNYKGMVDLTVGGNANTFEVASYYVYGPKIFSARQLSEDAAIVSRTAKIDLDHIDQLLLPKYKTNDDEWLQIAAQLRNDLLHYRQRMLLGLVDMTGYCSQQDIKELNLQKREIQIYSWLFMSCPKSYTPCIVEAIEYQREVKYNDLLQSLEAEVLLSLYKLSELATVVSYKSVVEDLTDARPKLESKDIGKILRNNGCKPYRLGNGYAVKIDREKMREYLLRKNLLMGDAI